MSLQSISYNSQSKATYHFSPINKLLGKYPHGCQKTLTIIGLSFDIDLL